MSKKKEGVDADLLTGEKILFSDLIEGYEGMDVILNGREGGVVRLEDITKKTTREAFEVIYRVSFGETGSGQLIRENCVRGLDELQSQLTIFGVIDGDLQVELVERDFGFEVDRGIKAGTPMTMGGIFEKK